MFAILAMLGAAAGASQADAPSTQTAKSSFNVPAEDLDRALRDLALQAKLNISYNPAVVSGLRAPAVKGELTIDGALSRVLSGTKLRAVTIDESTIQIVAAERDQPGAATRAGKGDQDLEEITVTGTHIRGNVDSSSPVLVFTRVDIDATGSNTVQQFLQTLTQNAGGTSENTIADIATNGRTSNGVNGSAPNLRGLGSEATLVLINGHRVAPGNADGSFVDVSMIPLTAVERIEVLTDGGSAIYGSDAVGGVVNIIMRKHFDGAETRAQIGSVTNGTMHNVQVGQTVGKDWGSGSALITYQYFDQTPLSASSRSYLHTVASPFLLLPEEVAHSAFANFDEQVAAGLEVHADAAYSHRSTYLEYSPPVGNGYISTVSPASIDGYGISVGATLKLPRDTVLGLSATYSESDTQMAYFQEPSPMPLYGLRTKAGIVSVEANLDGTLAALSAGPLRYAIGGQLRKETFGNTYFYPSTDNKFYPHRDVDAVYAELHVPLVASHDGNPADAILDLTLADRDEHYSDFGSSNNPKVGLIWKPLPYLNLRGTYGTSFKAPLLSELNPVPAQVTPVPAYFFNPAPTGTRNTLIVDGGNSNLTPEKAKVWTVGMDMKAMDGSTPVGKLTYYHIVFSDQISDPSTLLCFCDAFNDAALLGPAILNLNPQPSVVNQLYSAPTLNNIFNLPPSDIAAIYDSRYRNLSKLTTSGLDFGVGYKLRVRGTELEAGVDGTYVFDYDSQFANALPTSLLNTTYNPVNLRLRGRALFTDGPFSGGAYVNFVNAYSDNNVTPSGHVSSWTTMDAVASYEFRSTSEPLKGSALSLSVVNLADRAPPYVSNLTGYGITYDGVNANALGRYISLRLQKRW